MTGVQTCALPIFISRAFDIFITITIVLNILVTFAQTFDELSRITMGLKAIEYVTLGIFCVEYVLRIWTAEYLYPNIGRRQAKLRFLISFDGVIDLLTIVPVFFFYCFFVCLQNVVSVIKSRYKHYKRTFR